MSALNVSPRLAAYAARAALNISEDDARAWIDLGKKREEYRRGQTMQGLRRRGSMVRAEGRGGAIAMTYTAWKREHSGYCEGWAAYDIEAPSLIEAQALAHQRFAGTDGFLSMYVEVKPVLELTCARTAP